MPSQPTVLFFHSHAEPPSFSRSENRPTPFFSPLLRGPRGSFAFGKIFVGITYFLFLSPFFDGMTALRIRRLYLPSLGENAHLGVCTIFFLPV